MEPTNETRAERARRALYAYLGPAEENRIGEDSSGDAWDEAIRDLITDLGHLYYAEVRQYQTDPTDWTYDVALDRAHGMFLAEAYDEDEAS